MRRPVVALLLLWALGGASRAAEATLPDGSQVSGELVAAANAPFVFRTGERTVPLAGLVLRFPGSPKAPLGSVPFRIRLVDGSTFSADLLGLDGERLRVRTAWNAELALPRPAVAALRHVSDSFPRAVRGPGESGQDEVWLADGDQVFGSVQRADRDRVVLQLRSRSVALNWEQVRGVYLAAPAGEPRDSDGEHVHVWFRSSTGELDALGGVLRSVDESRVTVAHPVLGNVPIERRTLLRLRGVFQGRRQEIDTSSHHLGDPDRLSATLVPRRAEGISLQRSFRLAEVPPTARLRLDVAELDTDSVGQLQLWINGGLVADLARRVDRRVAEPRRLVVDVPSRLLRTGVNELEFRLTPLRNSERHPSCGVSGLTLELPR